MTRVAALDCGTNSIRLLVSDVDSSTGRTTEIAREMRIVRLGAGVDRTGRLDPAAIERTRVALAEHVETLRAAGAERVRMVATSATRDAENRDEFVAMVRAILGAEPEVITGAEEAALSFRGAVADLPAEIPAPYLVLDIGGGSTEFVLGSATVDAAVSVDVGCVRMTERHLHDDPPTTSQIAAVAGDVRDAMRAVREQVPVERAATLLGLAGSVTTVAAVALGHEDYRPEKLHHARISRAQVRSVSDALLRMDRDARAAIGPMHPGRVDVIGAGALVLRVIMDEIGAESVVASEHDILDGIAVGLATGG